MQGLKLACLDCKNVSSVVTVAFSCNVITAGEPWKTSSRYHSILLRAASFVIQQTYAMCMPVEDRLSDNQISISTSTSTSFVQLINLVPDIQLRILDRHWNADTRIILWHQTLSVPSFAPRRCFLLLLGKSIQMVSSADLSNRFYLEGQCRFPKPCIVELSTNQSSDRNVKSIVFMVSSTTIQQ